MDNNKKIIIAIDPGNIESAVAILRADTCEPISVLKRDNESLIGTDIPNLVYFILTDYSLGYTGDNIHVVIEKFQSYGMPVGKTTIDAIWWAGRFYEFALSLGFGVSQIYRKDVKVNLCGRSSAKDTNVTAALSERFARGESNFGKGKKDNPGWFYGFSADIWQAYAVGVTLSDIWHGTYEDHEEDKGCGEKVNETVKP